MKKESRNGNGRMSRYHIVDYYDDKDDIIDD